MTVRRFIGEVVRAFQHHFEVRSVFLQDAASGRFDRWSDFLGGPSTSSGVSVSEDLGEKQVTVFTAVSLKANGVAQCPCKIYDDSQEARDHALFPVVHDAANAEMSSYEFFATMSALLEIHGNAFAQIIRDDSGRVKALWPLDPSRMRLDRDDGGRLRYTYFGPEKRVWVHDPIRPPVLRLAINSRDGVVGRSTIRMLAETLGGAIATERFGSKFFANGAHMGGVVATDQQDLDDEQKAEIRAEIEKLHKGGDRSHGVLVLGAGYKFSQLSVPPEDSQFLGTKSFDRATLGAAFGIPPVFLGETVGQSQYKTAEQAQLQLLQFAIEPRLRLWESALQRDCLGPRESAHLSVRFVRSAFVRTDHKTLIDSLAVQIQQGMLSIDEARALLERPPLPEGAAIRRP